MWIFWKVRGGNAVSYCLLSAVGNGGSFGERGFTDDGAADNNQGRGGSIVAGCLTYGINTKY